MHVSNKNDVPVTVVFMIWEVFAELVQIGTLHLSQECFPVYCQGKPVSYQDFGRLQRQSKLLISNKGCKSL